MQEVIDLVNKYNAKIVGLGVLLDRSGGKVQFAYPLKPLASVVARTYKPEECPLCKEGKPLVKPGSRKMI